MVRTGSKTPKLPPEWRIEDGNVVYATTVSVIYQELTLDEKTLRTYDGKPIPKFAIRKEVNMGQIEVRCNEESVPKGHSEHSSELFERSKIEIANSLEPLLEAEGLDAFVLQSKGISTKLEHTYPRLLVDVIGYNIILPK